jgi:hypothetical protein
MLYLLVWKSSQKKTKIAAGLVTLIGGIGSGEIVTGPYSSDERPPIPSICQWTEYMK